ncbi:class I SAM-dependent methyltransferase [Parafrigoribacterium soli]|uniref:class I SAM-dependent methyltransferase n=1 Tax=Parafrigoribacterium soli TaxID=3144663 RepID=UPI0032EED989
MTEQHPHQNSAEFWEEFYGERGPWTGNPNAALVAELAERPLTPGSALDVACGTGGDAIWLAAQGWAVTGVDIARAALTQAARAAEAAGCADKIHWQQADLETAFPDGAWDLVSVAYLHSPVTLTRERILRSAATAVAPGGTLVIIGHQGTMHWAESSDGQLPSFPTNNETLAALDLADWTLVHSGEVPVMRRKPDGTAESHVDGVIRLRREPA